MTSRSDALSGALSAHQIKAWCESFDGVETDEDGWEHRSWRFALDIGDEAVLRHAVYRTGMGIEPDPSTGMASALDFVGSILTDCASVEPYADLPADDAWVEWADDLGLFATSTGYGKATAAVRKARDDFRQIAARRSLLIERIGEGAYRELIEIADEL